MEMVKPLVLLFFAGFLLFLPEMEAQLNAPPLCASQYALVNYACAFTPSNPSFDDRVYLLGQGQNYTPQSSEDHHGHGHGHGHSQHEGGHSHRNKHENGHNHRHRYQHESRNDQRRGHRGRHRDDDEHELRNGHRRGHHHGHEDEDEHENGSRRRHRHRRHHGHHHGSQSECCKWLNELDDECVCYLLVRLPPFLSRQEHKYSIRLSDSCQVSYSCPGRVRL